MAKKKKEHQTFDRMADTKYRLNKKAFAFGQQQGSKKHSRRAKPADLPGKQV